ncbi:MULTISPECIES: hypothetical protein [Streptomyces]|uniref:Tetratricopeptide repeat-containing protein n=1 Tax=Streptomyces melanosporofaciens TaxID=67327 RepID=A0A1H5AY73_STRMJ|nr:hypothetical protein [Streptomyces melanosporofaciens]SED46764.1 hypothetical protein SAMN04490356_8577 [Streptomyces melanosporofaciens]
MTEAQREAPNGDAVLTRIGQAVMLHRGGDREEARNRLAALWQEIERDGAPFHRCALAHYLADTQDDPLDELIWNLRALAAADGLTGALVPRAFFPSLHLNVATGYLKLGQEEAARGQLALARAAAGALGEDPYGDGVRAAILRLTLALEGAVED